MAKKPRSRRTTTTRKKKAAPGPRIKALPGRAPAGKVTDVATDTLSLGPAIVEVREPRPYKNRYPIPDEEFVRLKERAPKTKVPKGAMRAALDAAPSAEVARGVSAPALAMAPTGAPAAAPTLAGDFAGIAATGWIPPDCTLAVGPEHLIESVNSSVAIYNKTGGAPLVQRTLTQWFANVVQGQTIFDPKALYDQHERRWVLLAVAVKRNPNRSVFLLSVSTTSNPLGQWRNYAFDATKDGTTATNNWADFPGLGVDSHALYLTANMFAFEGNFQYAKIRVIPKAGPYSGGAAPFVDFVRMKNPDGTTAFTIQPAHTFGAPQVEYLVNGAFPNGNSLTLWRIARTGPAAFTLNRTSVPVSPYVLPPNADQKGGAPELHTGDVRLQHVVFRGDSLWTALTTTRNWGAGNRASIHWFQIRAAASALVQEGVYGTRNLHYFYPAACPDNNGNMVMIFSRSGAGEFGSIAYTGRRASDPLGSLQGSVLLKAGAAHYASLDSGGRNRWGDYNGIASDPVQTNVVWVCSEFASAPDTWGTWVGSTFF